MQVVPYRMQGDEEFDAPNMLRKRDRLRKSPRLRAAARRFWTVLGVAKERAAKTAGVEAAITQQQTRRMRFIGRQDYFVLHRRITRALAPELSKREAKEAAEQDWLEDLGGARHMDFEHFAAGLFGIADMWTDDVDEDSYTQFLEQLFLSVTDVDPRSLNGSGANDWAETLRRERASGPEDAENAPASALNLHVSRTLKENVQDVRMIDVEQLKLEESERRKAQREVRMRARGGLHARALPARASPHGHPDCAAVVCAGAVGQDEARDGQGGGGDEAVAQSDAAQARGRRGDEGRGAEGWRGGGRGGGGRRGSAEAGAASSPVGGVCGAP